MDDTLTTDHSSGSKMKAQTSLFEVYLRLRPPFPNHHQSDPWLVVEPPTSPNLQDSIVGSPSPSTHVRLEPPQESRKRAVERFGFTKIFNEQATQLQIFDETGTNESVKHVLQSERDGLVATLGVTGSGKSHTILGSKTQRGLTQMSLDVLFRSIGNNIRQPNHPNLPRGTDLVSALQSCDPSEAQIVSATHFLESIYGDGDRARLSRAQTPMSRAQTPMTVWNNKHELPGSALTPSHGTADIDCHVHKPQSFLSDEQHGVFVTDTCDHTEKDKWHPPSKIPFWNRILRQKRSPAKTCLIQDIAPSHGRRPQMPRPSLMAQTPDVSSFTVDVDNNCDFVVLVSMYEVYNDRIFDLLSTPSSSNGPPTSNRQAAALQKGLMRRPLLFKNTEKSPDRKVVAGLRKILCGTYEEAMMVLETGLIERRVAGTGSNSVSSRSHGFFCIEVKKNSTMRHYGLRAVDQWHGATLSVVDLAGSERARNAKTTGSTLAEAGKINESLMYLGQCLQVQSDCQHDGSKPIVPFRQCKLTELLFSNSFPSNSGAISTHRPPQKAIMIVTADPQGDFNATSQILRYSALAREVTVPRIPSVTSTILAGGLGIKNISTNSNGRLTPQDLGQHYFSTQELEQATNEINRLTEECNAMALRLTEEEIKRTEAEFKQQAAEDKMAAVEADIREECWSEMEEMMEREKLRWREAWEHERMMSEEYLDGKVGILEKTVSFKIHNDTPDKALVEDLERENEVLRAKLRALEQEMHTRSPTKKGASSSPSVRALMLQGSSNSNIATNPFLSSLRPKPGQENTEQVGDLTAEAVSSPRKQSLRTSTISTDIPQTPGTAVKKQRKLTTRKWDLGNPDELY